MAGWYHVASRKFCCCLPVRIGVFVLSALGAFFGGISAFAVWYTVVRTARYGTVDSNLSSFNSANLNSTGSTITGLDNTNWQSSLDSLALDKSQFYAFIAVGVFLTIYTLFSLFGFIGAVLRKRGLVAIYSTVLWFLVGIDLGIGIYMCIAAVNRRQNLAAQCASDTNNNQAGTIANEENKLTSAACNAAAKIGVAIYIIIFAIQWLIQLYCCIIVKRYVEQLSEEQGFKQHVGGNRIGKEEGSFGSYYPHQPLNQGHELGPYPYAQPEHGFGSKK